VNLRLRFAVLTIAALLAAGLTASLGMWQLSRASQKQALQVALSAQSSKALLDASGLLAAAAPLQLVHQRARLTGHWVADKTIFLDNRQMDARVGFYVLTPFVLQNEGGVVVVQRGWAPRNFESRTSLPRVATPAGLVEIEGRIAPPPAKLYELSGASLGAIRQNLDLTQFQRETGLPLLPITLLQTGPASEGLLRDWPAVNVGVDKHYGYAFQWFGLSTLIVGLYLWFQIFRRFIYRSKDPASHV
jgi:surfeit locus 1 family protein